MQKLPKGRSFAIPAGILLFSESLMLRLKFFRLSSPRKIEPSSIAPAPNSLHKLHQYWRNQSIRFKLSVVLLTTTAVSVFSIAHGVLEMSEHHFEERLQLMLQQQANHFGGWLKALADDHLAKAIASGKGIEMVDLDLNDPAVF